MLARWRLCSSSGCRNSAVAREKFLTATTAGLNGALAVWLVLMLASRSSEPHTTREVQATPAPTTAEAAPLAERRGPPAPQAVAAITLPPPPRPPVRIQPPRQTKPEPAPEALALEPLKAAAEALRRKRPIEPLRPSIPSHQAEDRDRQITPLRASPLPQKATAVVVKAPPEVETEAVKSTAPPEPAVIARGRTLLRLQEHGAGPGIEIAWPDGSAERECLYETLRRCHGMRLALMTPEGKLYRAEDAPGAAWQVDLDRFSGFIREARGWLASEEGREIDRLRRRHGIDGNAVRIFPRTVDAAFFGGLGRIVGRRYDETESIRAHYLLTANKVEVASIRLDGKPVSGRIALPAATRACAQP